MEKTKKYLEKKKQYLETPRENKKKTKKKQYLGTLWGGPLGENQKKPRENQKTKQQKKNNISRLFGDGPDPQDF